MEEDHPTGYFSQLLDIIAMRGNFVVEMQPTEEIYGIYNPDTRKWSGIMEKLANNETDLGLGEITITTSRLNVVDFSQPIVTSRAYYYMKKPNILVLSWNIFYLVIKYEKSFF